MNVIAMPVFENRISNRLDCSDNILLIAISDGVVNKRQTFHWAPARPIDKINQLLDLKVDVLICDGITDFYSSLLENTPIRVMPWIRGQVDEVLTQFLEGKLTDQTISSYGEP